MIKNQKQMTNLMFSLFLEFSEINGIRICLYILQIYNKYFMSRQQIYKIFHLTQDLAQNTSQKVFLLENELRKFTYGLKEEVAICSIMGPRHKVLQVLATTKKSIETKEIQNSDIVGGSDDESEFVLKENQKGAIYAVRTAFQMPNISTFYFILITDDKFYHVKPYNKKSILYSLVRFLGDLSDQIILLYDEQMNEQFQSKGSPYGRRKKKVTQMKVVARSIKNVSMKDIKCDTSEIFKLDEKFSKKIDLSLPILKRNISYFDQKVLVNKKEKMEQELSRFRYYLWYQIFMQCNWKADKVLRAIKCSPSTLNLQIAEATIQLCRHFYQAKVCQFARKTYEECIGFVLQINVKYCYLTESYYQFTYQQFFKLVNIKHQKKSVCHVDLQKIIEYITFQIIEEAKYQRVSVKGYSHYLKIFERPIKKNWEVLFKQFMVIYQSFLGSTEKYQQSFGEDNEECIEMKLFQLRSSYTNEDQIQSISICEPRDIKIEGEKILCLLKIPDLGLITKIDIHELKNSRKSKMLWIELQPNKNIQYTGALLTLYDNKASLINRFTVPGIKMIFNYDLQKCYILNPHQNSLTTFTINPLQKIEDEHTIYFGTSARKVDCFSITCIENERLFYLTDKKNILYCYDLDSREKPQSTYYHQKGSHKYLTTPGQPVYEYIRTFNQDIYIVLGNKEFLDILSPGVNGQLRQFQRILLDPALFIGTSLFGDKYNQFLLIHESNKTKCFVFENLKSQNLLQTKKDIVSTKGNPIIDIFYEAAERFGFYKTFSTLENPQRKKIRIWNFGTYGKEKQQSYLSEAELANHEFQYIQSGKQAEFMKSIQLKKVSSKALLAQIETRIPIQICTLEDGNVFPLIEGVRSNLDYLQNLTVAEKSRLIDFGIIEKLLKQLGREQVMVVSVMGAQSTGKSYLMNRIFGTRFTVASSRTTIGIWISLVKMKNLYFLVMDCEGLFAPDRTIKEEEKLIKILASLSDFTILNQNMGLNNRNLTSLLDSISNSVNNIKSNSSDLYRGQLLVVIRDVKDTEKDDIELEFERNFRSNEARQGNRYLNTLFGGAINIFSFCHFENKGFEGDIMTIQEFLKEEGNSMKFRNAQQILDTLKVVMTELCYDDNHETEKNLEEYKISKSFEEIKNIWLNGSPQNRKVELNILGKPFSFLENQITMKDFSDLKPLDIIQDKFQKEIIESHIIVSTNHNQAYKNLNSFITDFFQIRWKEVEKKMEDQFQNTLKGVTSEKKFVEKAALVDKIKEQKRKMRICLQQCPQCQLSCIRRFGHKLNIQIQRENLEVKIKEGEINEKSKMLTPDERKIEQCGLQKLKNQQLEQQERQLEIKKNIFKHEEQKSSIKKLNTDNDQSKAKAQNLKSQIQDIKRNKLLQTLQILQKNCQEELSGGQKRLNQIAINLQEGYCRDTEKVKADIQSILQVNDGFLQLIKNLNTEKNDLILKEKEGEKILQQAKLESIQLDKNQKEIQMNIDLITEDSGACEGKMSNLSTEKKQKRQILTQLYIQIDALKQQTDQLNLEIGSNSQKILQLETQKQVQEKQHNALSKELAQCKLQKIALEDIKTNLLKLRQIEEYIKKNIELKQSIETQESQIKEMGVKFKLEDFGSLQQKISEAKKKLENNQKKLEKKVSQKILDKVKEVIAQLQNYLKLCQNLSETYNSNNQLNEQLKKSDEIKSLYAEILSKMDFAYFSELVAVAFLQKNNEMLQIDDTNLQKSYFDKFSMERSIPERYSKYYEKQDEQILAQIDETMKKKQEKQNRYTQDIDENQMAQIEKSIEEYEENLKLLNEIRDFKKQASFKDIKLPLNMLYGKFLRFIAQNKKLAKQQLQYLNQNSSNMEQLKSDLQSEKNRLEQEFIELDDDQEITKNEQKTLQINSKIQSIEIAKKIKEEIIDSIKQKIQQAQDSSLVKIDLKYDSEKNLLLVKNPLSFSDLSILQEIYTAILGEKDAQFQHQQEITKIIDHLKLMLENKEAKQKIDSLISEENIHQISPQRLVEIFITPIQQNYLSKHKQRQENTTKKISQREDQIRQFLEQINGLKTKIDNIKEKIQEKQDIKKKNESREENNKRQIQAIDKKLSELEKQISKNKLEFEKYENSLKEIQEKKTENSLGIQKNSNFLKNIKQTLMGLENSIAKYNPISTERIQTQCKDYQNEVEFNNNLKVKIDQIEQQIVLNNQQIDKQSINMKNLEQACPQIKDFNLEQVNIVINKIEQELRKIQFISNKVKDLQAIQEKLNILRVSLKKINDSAKIQCSCLTNHKCSSKCQGCPQKPCQKRAGHPGMHVCSEPNHKCKQICNIEQCQRQCIELLGHSLDVPHNCNQSHSCREKCKYCDKTCTHMMFEDHQLHECDEDKCTKKCLLCKDKLCASNNHKHDDEAEIVQVKEYNETTKKWEIVKRSLHLCDQNHNCKQMCQHKGVCGNTYKQKKLQWKKQNIEREYDYLEQIQKRGECKKIIPTGKLTHDGECICSSQNQHKCRARCPDCQSLCSKIYGHPDSQKHSAIHRNQESLIYAAENQNKTYKIGEKDKEYIFEVGDVSRPTRCDQSCDRKGRGHFHLIQCKGGELCLEKQTQGQAKHSNKRYYPHPQKQYDQVLCRKYWRYYNFQMPTSNQEFDLCNFACIQSHSDSKHVFCELPAWHSLSEKKADHKFSCSEMHKDNYQGPDSFEGLQICFLLDITGSMSRFIEQSKKVIQNIIEIVKKKKVNLKISVVGYRDHLNSQSDIFKKLKQECLKKLAQLQNAPETGILGEKSIQMSFFQELLRTEKNYNEKKRSDLNKEQLQNSFSPKESIFLKYHFPFYFDIESEEDMVGIGEKLQFPLRVILNLLTSESHQKVSLKQYLLKRIAKSLQDLEEEQNKENQKAESLKCIQKIQLGSTEDAMNFLETMQADGGGDPPQAVFDGMNQVANLNWSKNPNIIKYIFHLFDAPPHGRIYAQNNGDRFPEGCPCGLTHQTVIERLKLLQAKYIIYPLTNRIEQTLSMFRESGLEFITKDIDKDEPETFTMHASEVLMRQIEQEDVMINRESF